MIGVVALCAGLTLGAGLSLAAADAPKPGAPTGRHLTDSEALTFENLLLREQLAQANVESARKDQQALYNDVCKSMGLAPADCSVDLQRRTVDKKPVATATATPPADTAQTPTAEKKPVGPVPSPQR